MFGKIDEVSLFFRCAALLLLDRFAPLNGRPAFSRKCAANAKRAGDAIGSRARGASGAKRNQVRRRLDAFYQVSASSNGNFIRMDTTESLGGLASFRQIYRPWLGYELDYGYTRYSEFYNKRLRRVTARLPRAYRGPSGADCAGPIMVCSFSPLSGPA